MTKAGYKTELNTFTYFELKYEKNLAIDICKDLKYEKNSHRYLQRLPCKFCACF